VVEHNSKQEEHNQALDALVHQQKEKQKYYTNNLESLDLTLV